MGLGKTYSTQYLLDSNNSSGAAGQVLISTATGVNWSDGTDIIGGPYLPLTAGSSYPLTGDLYLGAFNKISGVTNDNLVIGVDINNLSGGSSFDIQMDGSNSAFYINNSRNVGIGTTSPGQKLEVTGNTYVTGYVQASAALIGNKVISSVNYATFGSNSTATGVALSRDWNPGTYPDLIINPAGNVGIGTTTPERKLHVFAGESNGAASNAQSTLVLENSTNTYLQFLTPASSESGILFGDTDNDRGGLTYSHSSDAMNFRVAAETKMYINSSGNVGIGTTSPDKLLDVSSDSTPTIRITNTLQSSSNYTIGAFEFYSEDASNPGGARVLSSILCVNNAGSAVPNGELAFYTALGGGSGAAATEKMRITSAGNVGIGVIPNAPAGNIQLDVGDNGCGMTSRQNNELVLQANANYSTYAQTGKPATRLNLTNTGEFHFSNAPAGAAIGDTIAFTERMRIDSAGNVGIGTTSPIYKLDVVSAGDGLLSLTGATKPAMIFKVGTAVVGGIQAQANTSLNVSAYGTSSLNLQTAGTTPRLTILTGGNVGINQTAPAGTLHVQDAVTGDTSQFLITNGTGATLRMGITGSGTNENAHILTNSGEDLEFQIGKAADAVTPSVIFKSGGNVGIGTNSPNTQLEILNNNDQPATLRLSSSVSDGDTVAAIISFQNDAGGGGVQGRIENVSTEDDTTVFKFYTDNTSSPSMTLFDSGNMTIAGTLTQNSDVRLKENIKPIESALDKVKQMQGVEFNKINSSTKEIGVVAQEIEKIIPELVLEDKEGIKSVAYGNITAVLIEAIKEQQKQIEELKQQLNK